MASVMDMLAEVPFEETEIDEKEVQEEENTGDDTEDKREEKTQDLFVLSDEEDNDNNNNDNNNLNSFYTAPIDITERCKPAASKKVSTKTTDTSLKTDNFTASDIEGDDILNKDLSQPDPESSADESTRDEINKKVTTSKRSRKKTEKAAAAEKTKRKKKEYGPNNPDPNGPKYCHCRWGESGVMVECDSCGEWYHDECIGLTEEETYNIETYYCAPCCSKNSELITKYVEDPVKLRQRIIEQIRQEELSKKRRTSTKKESKTPKEKKVKTPKDKNTSISNLKKSVVKKVVSGSLSSKKATPKKSTILNRSLPAKRNFSFSKSSDDSNAEDETDSEVEINVKRTKPSKEAVISFCMCDECGDKFPNRKSLTRHKRNTHMQPEEIKYECDQCPKSFNTAKSLREHQVIHSGVKPFSCMFCGEAFYLMSQVTQHTNSKHLNVRHQCDQCSRSYSNRTGLVSHIKKVHGEDVSD